MVMFSSQVQQQIYASQVAMMQQAQAAQMMSGQMGTMPPGMMPMMPPMMQQMSLGAATNSGNTGIYGEQLANRMINAGRTAGTIGTIGLGVAGAVTGTPLDSFSAALHGGIRGYSVGGVGGAIGGAAMMAAPFMMASQAAQVYGGAFTGGMRDQASYNSTLRNNFNFQGGQGQFGRGFSQNQMGQIGNVLSQEVRSSPFTSSQELNQLISSGSEMGMFTAVRDVEGFTRKFKLMIDGLRKIQKELGGTLNEALQFTRGAQQVGIYSTGARTAFASEMRDTMASTGMDQNQLFSLAATGSMLSRATGGVGRQGAVGALRTARQLGAAVSSGVINQELLSEATGGLQGDDAIQAFTARTLQMSDRFSRSARGRYGLFAAGNADGSGLDEGMLARYRAGDMSVGEVMRSAHRNVNRYGRARALNQEGKLRGAMMEEGGLSARIMDARLMIGDRALDGGDDLAQLVLQRRGGMSQQESQLFTALIRNQRQIAQTETVDRSMASRQMAQQNDVRMNRSVDAFVANFAHGLQDMTGVTAARESGRRFLTQISSQAQKALDNFLGIQADVMTTTQKAAMFRIGAGMGSSQDLERMQSLGGGATTGSVQDLFRRTGAHELMHGLHMHAPQTYGEMMRDRGIDLSMGNTRGDQLYRQRMESSRIAAGMGVVNGNDLQQMRGLVGSNEDNLQRVRTAMLAGGRAGLYKEFAGIASANAVDAFAFRNNLSLPELNYTQPTQQQSRLSRVLAQAGQGAITGGIAGALVGGVPTAGIGAAAGGAIGAIGGGIGYGLREFLRGPDLSDSDKALGFIARGGHMGKRARMAVGLQEQGVVVDPTTGQVLSKGPGGGRMGISLEEKAMSNMLKEGVDENVMKDVITSDSFQRTLSRLPSLSGGDAMRELSILDRNADAEKDSGRQRAMRVGIMQLRDDIRAGRQPGTQWAKATSNSRRREEQERMLVDLSSQYGQIQQGLEGLEGATGGGSEKIAKLMAAVKSGRDAIAFGSEQSFTGATREEMVMMAAKDQARVISEMSPEEYAQISGTYGKSDTGRALLQAGAAEAAAVKELMGKGRTGRAGAASSALGLLTGNSVGGMKFSYKDEKGKSHTLDPRNQSRRIFQEWATGGKHADEYSAQLASQLEAQGVKDAGLMVQDMQSKVAAGRGLSKEESQMVYEKLASNEDLQKIQKEAIEKSQRQSDPLGVQRNDLLTNIKDAMNRVADKIDPDGMKVQQSGG